MTGSTWGSTNQVYLLVPSPDAPGGIARATATLANHLARTHPVEMIGVRRLEGGPHFQLDPRVRVSYVDDQATPSEREIIDHASKQSGPPPSGAPGEAPQWTNPLVDLVLPRLLHALQPGVVISTRPSLHLAVARHTPAHCITIAQDHSSLTFREATGAHLKVAEAIRHFDQYLVLTDADAESYRQMFPEAADRIRVIRNPAPWPVSAPLDARQEIVVAAGRLAWRKGFSRLIEAFRPLVKQHPQWELHIYGDGPQREALQRQIVSAELCDHVFLKGRTDQMERVLETASIFALTSKYEGLPMVLIEAMTKGVPVVSIDCPNGPGEIVVDGVTGRLVPNDDMQSFQAALLEMMGDPASRTQMSEQALRYARRYDVARICQTWQDLFDELHAQRASTPASQATESS